MGSGIRSGRCQEGSTSFGACRRPVRCTAGEVGSHWGIPREQTLLTGYRESQKSEEPVKTRRASDAHVGTCGIGADACETECPPPSGG